MSFLENQRSVTQQHRALMLTICVLNFTSSLFATLGNLLVIHALWKASSIPANLKKLFLSLAFSDLAVGSFAQLMYGIIIAVTLKKVDNKDYNFDYLCPTVTTISYIANYFLACATFLNITATAVDRLLAVSLHLRYYELVTSKRVTIILVSLWLTSGLATCLYMAFPTVRNVVTIVLECVGLLLTTVAYIRLYQVVRYHQNQLRSQLQLQYDQAVDRLREKKSAINTLYVFVVFLACYVPNLCAALLLATDNSQISFRAVYHASGLLILFNSSINPIVYYWRYREIREILKNTLSRIFRVTEATGIEQDQTSLSYVS